MLASRRARIVLTVSATAAVVAGAAAIALTRLVADGEYEKADARLAAELAGAIR